MTGTGCAVVLCACFLLYLSSGAGSRKISPVEVDYSDGCKFKNKFYGVGEQWSPRGVCQQNTCLKGGVIGGVVCPLIRIPEDSNCYLTEEDVSKGWPDCCGEVVCPPKEIIHSSLD